MKKILILFGMAIISSMQFVIKLLGLKKDTIPAFRAAIVDPDGVGMLSLIRR